MREVCAWPNLSEYFCHRAIGRSCCRWHFLLPEKRQQGKSVFLIVNSKNKIYIKSRKKTILLIAKCRRLHRYQSLLILLNFANICLIFALLIFLMSYVITILKNFFCIFLFSATLLFDFYNGILFFIIP